jgi:hypothetical protein
MEERKPPCILFLQEWGARMELGELVSYFGPRYCSLFCCTDDTTVSEDGELTLI